MQEGKAKMWKLGKITAKTHIGDYGQIVDSFVLFKDLFKGEAVPENFEELM